MSPHASDSSLAALLSSNYEFFDISPTTGFLDLENTAASIPESFQEHVWENVLSAANEVKLAECSSVQEKIDRWVPWRKRVEDLPAYENLSQSLRAHRSFLRRSQLVLSMLGHFYMHSQPTQPERVVPRSIALPWLLISESLGVKPVLSYASEILWNVTIPKTDLVSSQDSQPRAEDLTVLNTFTHHPSEEAFILAPVRIELEGTAIINSIFHIIGMLHNPPSTPSISHLITHSLQSITTALRKMHKHLLPLYTDCDPRHFYFSLRLWIAGTGPGGWDFQISDSEVRNLKLSGSTAGASALLQALDAFLGIDPDGKHGAFRREMQGYMPRGHRDFVSVLEGLGVGDVVPAEVGKELGCQGSMAPLKAFVQSAKVNNSGGADLAQLQEAYNNVVTALKTFRDEHFKIVSLFIINQAKKDAPRGVESKAAGMDNKDLAAKNDQSLQQTQPLQGTGGSDLSKLLKGIRNVTQEALL